VTILFSSFKNMAKILATKSRFIVLMALVKVELPLLFTHAENACNLRTTAFKQSKPIKVKLHQNKARSQ
jgi:hypothetical protein